MFSELLSSALIRVFSSAIWILDRLLEMTWAIVLKIAPLDSALRYEINATRLSTWNSFPYRSIQVPDYHWKHLLLTCSKYHTRIKDERWEEIKNNMEEIKHTVMAYITDELDIRSIPSHSWLVLKTIISLFRFLKAQQSIRESFRALEDLNEELQRRDQEKGAEEPIQE